jgi:hypothetical protein
MYMRRVNLVAQRVLRRFLSESVTISVGLIRLIFLKAAGIPAFQSGFDRRGALCGRELQRGLPGRVSSIVEILHPTLFVQVGLDNQLLCLLTHLVFRPQFDKWRHLLTRDG